jgi:hypothetical protein
MKKPLNILIILLIVLVSLGAGLFKYGRPNSLNPAIQSGNNQNASPINADTTKTYSDPDYFFSFEYPGDLSFADLPGSNGGKEILVQKIEGGSKSAGFQMTITPFDEPDQVLTKERIQKDAPEVVVNNPQEAIIGQNLHVLIFESIDPGLGKTREVWMVRSGNLYQITAPFDFDSQLAGILKTWKFQ